MCMKSGIFWEFKPGENMKKILYNVFRNQKEKGDQYAKTYQKNVNVHIRSGCGRNT